MKQYSWRLQHIKHFVKGLSGKGVRSHQAAYTLSIALEHAHAEGAIALRSLIAQILARGEQPGNLDNARQSLLEALREACHISSLRAQVLIQAST